MSNFNRVILIGNLTRDPDYKPLPSGAVTRLGVASNRQYKNKQTGNLVQEVCFIDVDVFGPQAESCRQYLQKGRPVLIEGRLKLDTWQAADGQTRSKHSIVAEKVVFLQAGPGANLSEGELSAESSQENELKPAQRVTAPKAAKAKRNDDFDASGTEDSFKFNDEPAFSDELPF